MKISNLILKINLLVKGLRGDKFYLFKKIHQKIKKEQVLFFLFKEANEDLVKNKLTIRKISLEEIFEFYQNEGGLTERNREFYLRVVPSGDRVPWGLFNERNELASIMFVVKPTPEYIPNIDVGLKEKILVILDARTAQAHRGNGYYPVLLMAIATSYQSTSVLGLANDWNIASQRGLIKAGFKHFATRWGKDNFKWVPVK